MSWCWNPLRRFNPRSLKFFADYNPFYLLSACCMLFGVFAMNDSLDWSPIPMSQLLTMIVTLNVYEAMLIGLAIFLLRRGIKRDAMILLIIEAFFLADVGFLNMEVFARSPWIGLVVNTFVLAAAVIKVAMVFRAAGVSLVDGKFAFVVIQLGVLFAVPGIFSIVAQPRDQKLPMFAIYAGWWLCGLLPVAYAVLVGSIDVFRRRYDGRPAGIDMIVARVLLVLPMLSLIAHLCLANWIYKVTFHPLNCSRRCCSGWRSRSGIAINTSRRWRGGCACSSCCRSARSRCRRSSFPATWCCRSAPGVWFERHAAADGAARVGDGLPRRAVAAPPRVLRVGRGLLPRVRGHGAQRRDDQRQLAAHGQVVGERVRPA